MIEFNGVPKYLSPTEYKFVLVYTSQNLKSLFLNNNVTSAWMILNRFNIRRESYIMYWDLNSPFLDLLFRQLLKPGGVMYFGQKG